MIARLIKDNKNQILSAVYGTVTTKQVHYLILENGGKKIEFSILPWDELTERMSSEEMLLAYLSGKGEAESFRNGHNQALDKVRHWAIDTGVDGQLLDFLAHLELAELDQKPEEESSPD